MDAIRNIVVATDFSELSDAATARALNFAQLDSAAVHLVHAVDFPLVATPYDSSVPVAVWEGLREGAERRLGELREALEKESSVSIFVEVSDSGNAVDAIAHAAEVHEADLVVMGTHGHSGIQHAFLGSVAERTVRTLHRPVLVVKESVEAASAPIQRILLAVDFSADSDRASELAGSVAARFGATLDVVHAVDLPRDFVPYASEFGIEFEQRIQATVSKRLEEIRDQIAEAHPDVPVSLHVRRGHPSLAISELAGEIDCQLIVIGTQGLTGLSHVLLGSVAERTLRAAPCSVLVASAGADRQDEASPNGETVTETA